MSKLDRLMKVFRLPSRPSGTAHWSNTDLVGSRHTVDFSWDQATGGLDVRGQIDGVSSFHANFAVVAGSLRLKECSGFPEDVRGSREVSKHLVGLLMQGAPPVSPRSSPSP